MRRADPVGAAPGCAWCAVVRCVPAGAGRRRPGACRVQPAWQQGQPAEVKGCFIAGLRPAPAEATSTSKAPSMALTDLAPLNRTHTAPPSHGMPLLILLRLRLRPLQVQGAALPKTPPSTVALDAAGGLRRVTPAPYRALEEQVVRQLQHRALVALAGLLQRGVDQVHVDHPALQARLLA